VGAKRTDLYIAVTLFDIFVYEFRFHVDQFRENGFDSFLGPEDPKRQTVDRFVIVVTDKNEGFVAVMLVPDSDIRAQSRKVGDLLPCHGNNAFVCIQIIEIAPDDI
jgi:hypothetical protein